MTVQELSEVRLAAEDDGAAIIQLLREMHGETGIGRFDPQRVAIAIIAGIARRGGVIGVIRSPGRGAGRVIEASIGLFIGASWCSSDPHLFDLWSFVGEPYRRSTHQKAMIGFAKQAASDLGLPLVMTVVSNEATARKERLFERQLPKSGSLFIFNSPAPIPDMIEVA